MESAARQEIEDRMRESILECVRLSTCERGNLRERHVQVLCSVGLQLYRILSTLLAINAS